MGCGASNSAAIPAATNNNRAPVPVPRAAPAPTPAAVTNRPLLPTKPYRHGSPISQREITKLRTDFWATRTDGNAQMWQSIKSSAEALLTNDVSLANAICEASNVTTPNGSLEVCYDERGYQYKVPQYCLSNPIELSSTDNGSSSPTAAAGQSTTENKSNKTASVKSTNNSPVTVKIRVNPGDHNLTVKADSTNSILELKAVILAQAKKSNLPVSSSAMEPNLQRIIFMGRELKDNMRISEVGFDEAKVVQVFLRPQQQGGSRK